MTRMIKTISILSVLLTAAAMLLVGCAQTTVSSGFDALENGNYPRALAYFEQALTQNPDDLRAKQGLGEVYFHQKDYSAARELFVQVRKADPKYGRASLYLGLAYEEQNDLSGAAAVYESYLLYAEDSQLANQIKGRLLYVRNQDLLRQVKEAIAFEKQQKPGVTTENSVGVLPFLPEDETSEMLKPLATGLAAAINYDLSQIGSIKVVERQKLRYLLDELKLVEGGYTAEESSPRLGRIVGAEHLVSGSVGSTGDEEISVNSGISDIATNSYSPALQQQETMDHLLDLQKRITFAIIDSLGIQLTPEERNAIGKIPTTNFDAFLAYSRGIDALDRGDYDQALSLFDRATVLDPGFTQAVSLQQEARLLEIGSGSPEEFAAAAGAGLVDIEVVAPLPGEDIFQLDEPTEDPRATDPADAGETGQATVGGRIR
ncbi:MAG: tetratricopeptide repeat protein [bacterium]